MKVILEQEDIMIAITVYMALKGFKTGENFQFGRKTDGKTHFVTTDIETANFKLENIQKYAREETLL